MSEVKRYHLTETGLVEGVALGRLNVVLAADYEVARVREHELQQRLNAADERNDEAIDLLRRARAVIEGGGWADLERDIAYFFKPAEPARCTNCDRATVEQCDDAGCGFLGAGNGAPE